MNRISEQPKTLGRIGATGGQWTGGAVLILIGAVSLLSWYVPNVQQFIVLLVGIALLGLFFVTRRYGFLIPGGIVTGVGAGITLLNRGNGDFELVVVDGVAPIGILVMSLGCGFLAVWLLGELFQVRHSHWWPLIPGGILTVLGGVTLLSAGDPRVLSLAWPLIFIGLGVAVLARTLWAQRPAG